jgi:DNA-binding CsgD family transcriptional regulator
MATVMSISGTAKNLTARECEVATLTRKGLTNKEIARRLGIVEGTVKLHMHSIFGKCGVRNRMMLLAPEFLIELARGLEREAKSTAAKADTLKSSSETTLTTLHRAQARRDAELA